MQVKRIEIVRVASPGFFVNVAHKACRHGGVLDNGYYLALGGGRSAHSSRDADLRFYGPFATEAEARLLAVSAQALGLTEAQAKGRRQPPRSEPPRPRQHDRRGDAGALRVSDRTGFALPGGGVL